MSAREDCFMSLSEPVKEFEGQLDRPENQQIIKFLKAFQPSAHTDIVQLLVKSVSDLPDVQFYCPDTDNHAYYLAHTRDGVIFAAAIGMSALMFRIPPQSMSEALQKGGEVFQEVGEPWVSFNPFWPENEDPQQSRVATLDMAELKRWSHLASQFASANA
jgi:hypothetical protein